MTRQELLAESLRISYSAVMRYAKGFDDNNRVAQAANLPNHFAWTMGHLALTLHRNAERIDGQPLPPEDFLTADGRGGNSEKFDTESVSFGSHPQSDAALYPSHTRCTAIFSSAIVRCAEAFNKATDQQLDASTKFGALEMPMWQVAIRMIGHNGAHAGQLADLRRALGMGSIFS